MITTILIGIAVLSVLVIAHELGHFISAKAIGVKVEEFGLGYPPRLISFERGETRYSLNAIPFGGFTKLAGEEDPKVPRSLASKGIGARLLVISAGALVNLLLPLLLFSIAFMIPHNVVSGQVVVKETCPDSPAALAGIQAEDTILEINGKTVQSAGDLYYYIQLNLGNEVTLLIEHPDSTTENVQLIPRWRPPEGEGAMGTLATTLNPTIAKQSYPFWKAIPLGAIECIETFILFKNGVINVIIGATPVTITGPVGIVHITGEVSKAGMNPLLKLAAFLSLALGLTQLLPLPALDGGRIAFVLLEWVRRGKRVSPKTEGLVHLIGFVMLIMLMFLVTYQDIIRIISGDSLIP